MSILDDFKKAKADRALAEWRRESFFELHQRQKETFDTQKDRLDHYESNSTITINSMARLGVYVMLIDIHLGVFINHAKMRARMAYLTGARIWHQHYIHDVADIDIKLSGRTVHIRIMPADQFYMEFATSALPITVDTVTIGATNYSVYKGCLVGVDARVQREKMVVKPRILKNRRDKYADQLSQIGRAGQVQLISEPVRYPFTKVQLGRERAVNTLFEAYCPHHAWTGVLARIPDAPLATFSSSTLGGPMSGFDTRDYGFDIPWADNSKSDPARYAYIRGAADWPLTSGKQRVQDSHFGDRDFAIYIDAFNQFSIFPVAAIEGLNPADSTLQNVSEVFVTRKSPTLPAWAYAATEKASTYWATTPDVQKWGADQPYTDWRPHPDGTKFAAIFFEREAYSYDTTFWSHADINPNQTYDATKFADWVSYMGVQSNYCEGQGPQTYNPTRYYIAPGVVEVEVKITLTGPDLNQYTVELVTRDVLRPSTSYNSENPLASRWPLFIDYVWHDVPKRTNTNALVKKGTLVSLDMEYWIRQDLPSNGTNSDRWTLLSCRNMATNEEIFSSVGAKVMGIDLRTLSMVLRIDSFSTEQRPTGSGTPINFVTHHFGAWIVHNGIGKEVLFPDGTPDAEKLKINSYASLTGRDYLAGKMAETGGGWEYVPPTTPYDGYSDAGVNNVREIWAYEQHFWYNDWYAFIDPDVWYYGTSYPTEGYVRYRTGTPPAQHADYTKRRTWLNSIGGDYSHLFHSDSPRWGWNQYASATAQYIAIHPFSTFFTHPNGSYMFWDDSWVYDQNGLPGDYVNATGPGATSGVGQGTGTDYIYDTLAAYDVSKVKLVIFDRVHFEIRVKDRPAYYNNTTFMDLYNRAVQIGKANKTLPESENINEVTPADLQPTFIKEIGDNLDGEFQFLDLKIEWNGLNRWYREAAYLNFYGTGTQFPPFWGWAGNFNNLNVYAYWREATYVTSPVSSTAPGPSNQEWPANWHFRFADPIIIMEK